MTFLDKVRAAFAVALVGITATACSPAPDKVHQKIHFLHATFILSSNCHITAIRMPCGHVMLFSSVESI